MAGHHRITTEPDGTQRLCTFSSGEAGLDLTTKILELDDEGNKVRGCQHIQICWTTIQICWI